MSPSPPDDPCDEGGGHVWAKPRSIGGLFLAIFCCPCYAMLSCCMSEGAAFTNPWLEQCCGDDSEGSSQSNDPMCKKCGLTLSESIALHESQRQRDSPPFLQTTFDHGSIDLNPNTMFKV
ncbi:hypothetical protein BOTBODRAFT_35834 [Botryobasidium botryosum FD-172 SS1]|uniref:Uncharacterized protein n=1 Tax=Botryobasidium botryosum (strain FD-172 SS1) TaxID=930990 RepID=A0A067M870_BOTB1|nr:hypothetical protein BOTBODRAFT_35834 [Botryobasidium botryosum FD-172 SS1]